MGKPFIFAVTYFGKEIPDMNTVNVHITGLFQSWMEKHESNQTNTDISANPAD